ncbi:MAG: sulfotransferase [Salinivenus sp.]
MPTLPDMAASRPPINLVYVASIGRSGTTLFESMLGAHSQIESLGELHLWPHEIRQGGVQLCGTGYYVQDCPFWSEMRRHVDPLAQHAPQIDHFREKHDGGRTLRPSRLSDFRPGPVDDATEASIRQYGENNHAVFSAFQDEVERQTGTRPTWLVDASKDPYRLLWLQRSGLFNLKVFHLVKHPCGFAYSVTKDRIHDASWATVLPRYYHTARQSLAWVVQNRLLSRIAERFLTPNQYRLLHYEQIATAPYDRFREACAFLDLPYEASAVTDFRSGSRFTLAGNPMRYEDRPIELDERWKDHLPSTSRRIVQLVTAGASPKYGY